MGDVVQLERTIYARVRRFNRVFSAKMHVSVPATDSDPRVAIYVDDTLVTWVAAEFLTSRWSDLSLDLSDDERFVEPDMLGMTTISEHDADTNFLIDAEDYILALLRDELVRQMVAQYGDDEAPPSRAVPTILTPRERAMRTCELWHNHGCVEAHLPMLIAIEIANAAEEMGEVIIARMAEIATASAQGPVDIVEVVGDAIEGCLNRWQKEDELRAQ